MSRLGMIASLVPEGARVADVGSGHGRLALRLLAGGRASWCLVTERTPLTGAALSRLRPHPRLEVRFGPSLRPLQARDSIDVIVLAGMGTRTIIRILDDPRLREICRGRLLLQPQTEPARLRRWLDRAGLAVVAERLAVDRGRHYTVVAAEPKRPAQERAPAGWTDDEIFEIGPRLLASGDPEVDRYWVRQRRLALSVLRDARGAGRRRARVRLELAQRVLQRRID